MVITIDDGFHDFMEYALPILADNNLPAVHNVLISSIINNQVNWTYRLNLIVEDHLKSKKNFSLTEYMIPYRMIVTQNNAPKVALETMLLLKDLPLPQTEKILSQLEQFCESDLYYPKMMNESDLKSCEAAGIEIGSHGWTHILLKGSLGAEILKHEIVESKIALEKCSGMKWNVLHFPLVSMTMKWLIIHGKQVTNIYLQPAISFTQRILIQYLYYFPGLPLPQAISI